jgi:hypothetical protein
MTTTRHCPICDAEAKVFTIDDDVLEFLVKLRKDSILNEYLRVCKVHLDIINQGAPTAAVVTKAINMVRTEINKTTTTELGHISDEIPIKIQEILQDKIPDSEQLQTLINALPQLTVVIQDLLKKQEIPQVKGKIGEREIAEDLSNYFPEDEVVCLGKSGETDIIVRPLHNGIRIGHEVFFESKKNKYWNRSYLDQTSRHMSARGCSYAILAVETMPAGANGYLTEFTDCGTIFVTGRKTCVLAYGALKAVLINEFLIGRKEINLKAALADTHIREAISKIFTSTDSIEALRKKTKKIIQNAKGINSDVDAIEDIIRYSIQEIQRTINQAIENIQLQDSPEEQQSASTHTSTTGKQIADT